jgi:hypothetical protein
VGGFEDVQGTVQSGSETDVCFDVKPDESLKSQAGRSPQHVRLIVVNPVMERAGDMGNSVDALDGLVESAASSHILHDGPFDFPLVLGMTGFPRLGLVLGSDGASDRVAVLEEGEGCGGPYETCDLMHASSGVSMSGSE